MLPSAFAKASYTTAFQSQMARLYEKPLTLDIGLLEGGQQLGRKQNDRFGGGSSISFFLLWPW